MRVLPRMLAHTLQEWFLHQHILSPKTCSLGCQMHHVHGLQQSRMHHHHCSVDLARSANPVRWAFCTTDRKTKTEVVAKDVPRKGRSEHLIATSLGRRPPKSHDCARVPQTQWQEMTQKNLPKFSQEAVPTVVLEPLSLSKVAGSWKKHLLKHGWRRGLLTSLDCISDCACTASPAAPRMPT